MFDIGWSELLLIGIVALIVVGPEDLPRMFHALGRITARAKSMAREFSRAMEDAAKTSGLDEASKTLRDVKDMTSKNALGLDALDRAASSFEKWEPKLPSKSSAVPKATDEAATPASPSAEDPVETAPVASVPAPEQPEPAEDHGRRQLHVARRSDRSDG